MCPLGTWRRWGGGSAAWGSQVSVTAEECAGGGLCLRAASVGRGEDGVEGPEGGGAGGGMEP